MNFYTPIFSKIVDSSIWSEPDYVVKVFITMIAKQDKDNVVRGTAYNISCWAKKTEAETIDALKILCSPDTRRIEPQPYDGRRIEKVEDGYLILNGAYYQKEMQKINRRAYLAQWQKGYREEKKQEEAKEPQKPTRFQKPTLQQLLAADMPKHEAEKFLDYFDSVGWVVGKGRKPMKDWEGAVRGWLKRSGNGGESHSDEAPLSDAEILRQAMQ